MHAGCPMSIPKQNIRYTEEPVEVKNKTFPMWVIIIFIIIFMLVVIVLDTKYKFGLSSLFTSFM